MTAGAWRRFARPRPSVSVDGLLLSVAVARQYPTTIDITLISGRGRMRDVILPGDMKGLMNKVMEAKKAAEANLIARREERP